MRRWWLSLFLVLGIAACDDGPTVENLPPEIVELLFDSRSVVHGETARLVALAGDPNGDPITYSWTATGGSFLFPDSLVTFWTAPDTSGTYVVRIEVSDGTFAVADSLTMSVGQGSIAVTSNPSGVEILLDFRPTGEVTPFTFEGIPLGNHTVQVRRNEVLYEPDRINLTVEDGAPAEAHFEPPSALVTALALGRDDIEEMGTFAWSPFGLSFLYCAVTTEHGAGIYNYDLTELTEGGAVLLTTDVDITEPIDVYRPGSAQYLWWTSLDGELMQAELFDGDEDGIFEMGPEVVMVDAGFGISIGETLLLFSEQSSQTGAGLEWADISLDPLSSWFTLTASGRHASWKPGSDEFLVYEDDGELIRLLLTPGSTPLVTTLSTGGGIYQPAWGQRSLAYLTTGRTAVVMQKETATLATTLTANLTDARDLAWHPSGAFLVVTHNPSGGEALKLESLPFPETP